MRLKFIFVIVICSAFVVFFAFFPRKTTVELSGPNICAALSCEQEQSYQITEYGLPFVWKSGIEISDDSARLFITDAMIGGLVGILVWFPVYSVLSKRVKR